MTELISGCWILMELIAGYLFFSILMQPHKLTYIKLGVIITLWLFLFLCTNYLCLPIPIIFITIPAYLVLSFICYTGAWIRHCVAAVMCILLLAIVDTSTVYISSLLLGLHVDDLYAKKHLYLTIVTVSKSFSVLIAWIAYRIQSQKKQPQLQIRWLVLTLLFPLVSLIMLVAIFDSFQQGNDISAYALAFTVAIFLANVAIIYIINRLEKTERELFHSTLLSQQMEVQTKSIIALEKSYRAQRESAHEFSHHLSAINALVQKGQYDVLTQYISRLANQQSTRVFCVNSHNPIIDAILNQKYQLASELGIEMQIKVNDLSDIAVPTDSIVVLLSNLLDNAIDACNRCASNKIIRFSLISDSTIFLTIDNTSIPVSIVDGEIATTKSNKHDHGYGLINVKRVLRSLDAEYAFRYNNGWFSFVAEIPIN